MTRQQFTEMMDAQRDLTASMMNLLRLNWKEFPWAKKIYYELDAVDKRLHVFSNIELNRDKEQAMLAQKDESETQEPQRRS